MSDTSTDPAPEPRSRRARFFDALRRTIITVILLGVVLGAYLYFETTNHAPEPQQVAAPQAPIPVGAITVQARDVPVESSYLAQTEASQVVPVRARVSGYLLDFAFEEGERVEENQVIYRIDPEPFEVALAQANAQLAAAQARRQRAKQQLERFRTLVERQAAAAQELEQWQQEYDVAAADVQLQQARVEQAELELSYTTIRAPITGIIAENLQDVGSYISPATGEALLTTLRQIDPIFVRFSVSEQDLLRWQRLVSAGEVTDIPVEQFAVQIILGDGREYPYLGRINFVDVAIDPSTGTAVVRVTVPNPEDVLRPGQYVTAKVTGAHRVDATLVPQRAVMQTPAGTNVYVVDEQGVARMRPVEPGEWYGDQWIIESGLEPGERVIVDHLMQVRPGMRVEPHPPADVDADESLEQLPSEAVGEAPGEAPGEAVD